MFGVPSALVPIDPVRAARAATPDAVGSRWSSSSAPTSRPGTAIVAEREAVGRVGHRDRPVPERLAGRVADHDVRRRPEPVLVERVAADRERVVDPDRLRGDLLRRPGTRARSVVKSLAWPVSRNPGASNPRFCTSSRPGVPIGWTVSESPSATTRPCSSPSRARHRGRDEEQDQPDVADQRRQLRPAVAVAVDVRRRRRPPRLADDEPVAPEDRRDGRRVDARPSPPGRAASGRRTASGWTTRISLDWRHSRGVRSSVQTTIEMTRTMQPDAEPGRGEDVEELEPLERVDDARPEDRVVAGVDAGHLVRVVARPSGTRTRAAAGASSRRRRAGSAR